MYLLHYTPDSSSLIIRLLMEEAGLPYRTARVDHDARRADSDGYRSINPTGLIPALETPQGVVFETGAILLWLCDRHGLGPDNAAPARTALLKWLFFLSNTLHAELRLLFYPQDYVQKAAQTDHHARVSARLKRHFTLIDAAVADTPGLFAPGGLLAPYIVCLMRWSVLYAGGSQPWFVLADYPALANMAQRLETRPATHRLIAAEGLGPAPFTALRPATPSEEFAI
jgi:glutathione S-transferase